MKYETNLSKTMWLDKHKITGIRNATSDRKGYAKIIQLPIGHMYSSTSHTDNIRYLIISNIDK